MGRTRGDNYVPGDPWIEDKRSGRLIRRSDSKKEWTGVRVQTREFELRNPQDRVKAFFDKQAFRQSNPPQESFLVRDNALLISGESLVLSGNEPQFLLISGGYRLRIS